MIKSVIKSLAAGMVLASLSMSGTAQAEADYPFAATGFLGGGVWLSELSIDAPQQVGPPSIDVDIARIIGGGDFVVPINGYWNAQFGGAVDVDHGHVQGDSFTDVQGQFNTLGFWRNPDVGVFGLELGILGPKNSNGWKYVKAGGVAEYFFGEMATIGAFGGVLVPFGRGLEPVETGYYAGGHLTYYATHNIALAAFGRYTHEEVSLGAQGFEWENINVGGKVRYLTSVPGLEIFASGAYRKCDSSFSGFDDGGFSLVSDGVEVMAGVQIRLGGHTDSLVSIDRSNALDTRAWSCFIGFGGIQG